MANDQAPEMNNQKPDIATPRLSMLPPIPQSIGQPDDNMVPLDVTTDDTSAAAHDEILAATENLTNLADYCETNFKESKVVVDRPEVTIENGSK